MIGKVIMRVTYSSLHFKINVNILEDHYRLQIKKRSGIHKLKDTAEKASADYLSAIIFVDDLAENISKENFIN